MYKGIDVSSFQGNIDWKEAKKEIDFAIIRAGYGQNNIDSKCVTNINGCVANDIPFGLYWFSYALDEASAIREANFVCNIADRYNPDFPIVFDFEYASDEYANKNGIVFTNEDRYNIAEKFMSMVEIRGYRPMIYTNPDYLNKGFQKIADKYDLWLAVWGNKPTIAFDIWQATSKGKIKGISTAVDIDYTEKLYNRDIKINMSEEDKNKFIKELVKIYTKYIH